MPLTRRMIHDHLNKNKNSPKSALLNEGYFAFLPPAPRTSPLVLSSAQSPPSLV